MSSAGAGAAVVQFLTQSDCRQQTNAAAVSQRELLSAKDMETERSGAVPEHTVEIQAVGSDRIPSWALATGRSMAELLRLPPGWNSYRARPISRSAAQRAFELLKRIMSDLTPAPDVVPTSPGGVQLEWHTTEIDVEITFPPTGSVEVYVRRLGAVSVEGALPQSMPDLQDAIGQLSGRIVLQA